MGGYIRGRRLTRAAQLLLNTDRSIIEVAFRVGFASHEAFTRSFKTYFSQSPKNFRKDRPNIYLKEKPRLSPELFEHLAEGMDQSPIIAELPPRYLLGFKADIPSPFVSNEDYCDILYEPWTTLLRRQNELQHRIEGEYYGLMDSPSGNFTEETVNYIAAAAIHSPEPVPQGMVLYSFPKQTVAMFDVFAGTENNLSKTIDFIYGYWLPNSAYTRDQGNDYEWFQQVKNFEDPNLQSKYVLPILNSK